MPELPEVETIVRGLDKRVTGDMIESVWIGKRTQPLKSPAAEIAAALEGKKIVRVHRAGKHIVFNLEKKAARTKTRRTASPRQQNERSQWIVHLGMTGRMLVCESAAEIAKHTHLVAKLASGRELRFVDPRMFGKLSVHTADFDPGGVEPLEVAEEEFLALFRGRGRLHRPVFAALHRLGLFLPGLRLFAPPLALGPGFLHVLLRTS